MRSAVREDVRVNRGALATVPAARRHVMVLSGGGARGAAQAGALAALLQAGIEPVGIVGCSVGALNGAFLAVDPTPERAEELAGRWGGLRRRDVFGGGRLKTWRNIVARRPALYSEQPLRRLVADWLPVHDFADLAVPLRVVTTSLTSGRAVYHGNGPLADVLLASAALPGLFPPVQLPAGCDEDGTSRTEQHVDGGVTDLVPVAGALDLAPTDIWLLDIAAHPGTGAWRVRSALDVLVASLAASIRCRPLPQLGGAVLHHVELGAAAEGPGGLMDFTRTADLVEAGRVAGAAAAMRLAVGV